MDIKLEGANRDGFTKFSLPSGTLDLKKTFECGQCFRWVEEVPGIFSGVVNGNLLMLKKLGSSSNGRDTFIVNQPTVYFDTLTEYLGLHTDYSDLEKLDLDEFAREALEFGKGIRILHQEVWETIVSFLISQRNSIPRIRATIEKICEGLGDKKVYSLNGVDKTYYTFPTPQKIAAAGVKTLSTFGLGYRAEYIYLIAIDFANNRDQFDTLQSKEFSGSGVIEYLQQFKGIGPKVANCIALFGYNKLDMFPIDVWIQRIIDRFYNGNIDPKIFGSLAGLMQQYMFYFIKQQSKEIT